MGPAGDGLLRGVARGPDVGGAETVGAQIAAGFAGEVERSVALADTAGRSGGPGKLIVRDVVTPRGGAGVVTLAFEQGEHRGRLRARLDGDRIAALACFANQREPIACETACNGLLGAIK